MKVIAVVLIVLSIFLASCTDSSCKNVTISYTESVPVDGAALENCMYTPLNFEILQVDGQHYIKNNDAKDAYFGYTTDGQEEFVLVKAGEQSTPFDKPALVTTPPTKYVCNEGPPQITIEKVQRTQKFEVCFP